MKILILPGWCLGDAELRSPVLPLGKPVLPLAAFQIEGELIIRSRLLAVLAKVGPAAEHHEPPRLRIECHRNIPAVPGDVRLIELDPGVAVRVSGL